MKAAIKKLISVFLMLIFTAAAFAVLAVSVVLLAAESVISAILSPGQAPKKGSLKDRLSPGKLPSRESQSNSKFKISL